MNYKVTYSDEYLSHHGILGQKWGKRNGPPYPLDAGDHSASEKKAGWKESLRTKRLRSASEKQSADAEDLRKHGYGVEADAVKKVSEKTKAKYEKSLAKDKARSKNKRYTSSELKAIKKDRSKYEKELRDNDQEYKKLDEEYGRLYDEINDIVDKYGLDWDDGGGGNTARWSESNLAKAKDRYQTLNDRMQEIEYTQDELSKGYRSAGEKYVKNTYGDVAINQIKARENATAAAAVTLGTAYMVAWATQPAYTAIGTAALLGAASVYGNIQAKKEKAQKGE